MKQRLAPEDKNPIFLSQRTKRIIWGIGVLLLIIIVANPILETYTFYYVPQELPPYTINTQHHDDTLRIAFIGDSWADYHTTLNGDTMIANAAKPIFNHPIKTATRGKKGAISKEIYYFMFSSKTIEHSYEPDRCTQPLIEEHPNYCVIFAGINDVTFLRHTSFYAKNMYYIINLLLHNKIRPVIIEIPLVNFKYPMPYFRFRDRWFYRIRSVLMGTWNNEGEDYQEALKIMIENHHLKDSILYIAAKQWNPEGCLDTTIFLSDKLHLNLNGYHQLDSCIATEIIKDFKRRNKNN